MILSVSRRTDIPACYSQWFFRRLEEGYAYTRNPMNPSQVSRISLTPQAVDCIVFWSKDPAPMLEGLPSLSAYLYYFQFTLNAYEKDAEPFLPSLAERIRTFRALSGYVGKERVIWRYDPIIFTQRYSPDFHLQRFRYVAEALKGFTCRCVISFLDRYPKIEKQLSLLKARDPSLAEKRALAEKMAETARSCGMHIYACAEKTDLSGLSICPSSCIDPGLISSLAGMPVKAPKDRNQRKECGCCESVDIGVYNTCLNGCRYCYANYSIESVRNRAAQLDPLSPLLCGQLQPGDIVRERALSSIFDKQLRLF